MADAPTPDPKLTNISGRKVAGIKSAPEARQRVAWQLRRDHHFGVDDADTLYRFDEGRWQICTETWVRTACHKIMAEAVRGHLTPAFVTAVHGMLKADQPLIVDKPPSGKINFCGTVLDVITGQAEEAMPNNWSSTVYLPIRWNPEAKTAPRWLAYLESMIPPDALTYTLELIASCMVSDVFSQNIIWLAGEGGNGKGTLLLAIEQLIGPENVANVSFHTLSSDRFAMAQIKGKLLLIDGDSSLAQIKDSSILKKLSAHDVVYAQEKYGRPFPLRSFAKPIVAANGRPNSRDISQGFFDRPLIFPMEQRLRGTAKERLQADILAELRAESSGFVNVLVPHLRNLFMRKRFQVPDSIMSATADFKAETHPMAAFFGECLELHSEGFLDEVELRQAQHEWADSNGFSKLNREAIYSWLKTNHPEVSHARPGPRGTQRIKRYLGIRFIR